jgi:small subunit ribosomal protein S20
LPNIHAAEKAMRRSAKLQVQNRVARSRARSEVKQASTLIAAGKTADAEQATLEAIRALDKAAQKGTIKKNNAARRKSRLIKQLNALRAAKK